MKIFLILFIALQSIIIAKDPTPSSTNLTQLNSNYSPGEDSKIFYGGNIGFYLWDKSFYLALFPTVGYNISNEFSIGGRLGYAYLSNSRYDPTLTSNNFGGGIFLNYKVTPQVYLLGEFLYFSFERAINITQFNYEKERVGVPFLLLGGGYIHRVNDHLSAFLDVSFDVLRDDNSPFSSGRPFIRFGVGVGI